MSEDVEAKLEVLKAMNSALGKITNAQVRLVLAGEQDLADQMDGKRKELLAQIETLQCQVAEEWTVAATTLTEKLRQANSKVQDRIRNIKNQVNVADNAIKIIGQIDDALAFLKTVVP